MSLIDVENGFNLYYQDKYYSWDELKQQTQTIGTNLSYLIVLAQEHFSTIIHLIYGMTSKKVVLPVSLDLMEMNDTFSSTLSMTKKTALAIATSGTESKPKIIIISDKNITSHCQHFAKIIPMDSTSVWLNCMPLNHIAGVMIVYRCWFNNASMVLHEGFNVQKVWGDIEKYSVTHISLVPRMLSRLLEHCQYSKPPATLKYIIVGGDKISDTLFQRAVTAGWPIYLSYGMTETTSTIAIGQTSTSLKPLGGFELQVSQNNVLKIKGDMVADSVSDSHDWFETNDRVRWNGHFLSVQGRNDDMIISGGKNISPQYLESLLSASDAIDDIAISKVSNDEWGETIVALFCGDLQRFKDWISTEIPSAYQPKIFIELEFIPRNDMGKINRKGIRELINKNNLKCT